VKDLVDRRFIPSDIQPARIQVSSAGAHDASVP
jgi:hypothetical protein